MKFLLNIFCALFLVSVGVAQNNYPYWQQQADYTMEIDFDVKNSQYKGVQEIVYTNNSPDTLHRVFYHLYFNAFQPGSEMDIRSRTIADPDGRVGERISKLTPKEQGYIKPTKLTQNGNNLSYHISGTIMEVELNSPILPGSQVIFNMEWDAQVPIQIRRSGRNSKEGVEYSMTQWFPKLAEYDFEGWHADPYIYREFHSVWGNYDVRITIDEDYTIGGSGYLQNPNEIGHGYQTPGYEVQKSDSGKLTWHFVAPNVHDFAWAADSNYLHDIYPGPNGVDLHFIYKNNSEIIENWKNLQPKTYELMQYFNQSLGPYPYEQYTVIQGGDGGMEYAMSTLITGERSFRSLFGVTAHELAHSWFQFLLATHEGKHPWMDEGFTSYISNLAEDYVLGENSLNPNSGGYSSYYSMAKSGKEEPASTHADRYSTNRASSVNTYNKGTVFLAQLGYVIGEEDLQKTLKRYFKEWAFKHPTPNDFIRVAEKVSGFELDWYLMDWIQTTKTIDYGIQKVLKSDGKYVVSLERIGMMPMPIDVYVQFEDGSQEMYYIPLRMARAEKSNPFPNIKRTVLSDWAWANPSYDFEIVSAKKIKAIMIDATQMMADINPVNNLYTTD